MPLIEGDDLFFDLSHVFFAPVSMSFATQSAFTYPSAHEVVGDDVMRMVPDEVVRAARVRGQFYQTLPLWTWNRDHTAMSGGSHQFNIRPGVGFIGGGQSVVVHGTLDTQPTVAKFIDATQESHLRDAIQEILMHAILCANQSHEQNVAQVVELMGAGITYGFPRDAHDRRPFVVIFTRPVQRTLASVVYNKTISRSSRSRTLAYALYQVCRALQGLQRDFQFMHRDLKIDNVMIDFRPESFCFSAKIIDLGLSRMVYKGKLIATWGFMRDRALDAVFNPYTDLRMFAWSCVGYNADCPRSSAYVPLPQGGEPVAGMCTGYDHKMLFPLIRDILAGITSADGSVVRTDAYPYNHINSRLYDLLISNSRTGVTPAQAGNRLVRTLRKIARRTDCAGAFVDI